MSDSGRGVFYLVLVSCIWAFSFGIIKTWLPGMDSPFLAFCRLALALLLFVPLLRPGEIAVKLRLQLLLLGSIQYGLMYMLLFQAFFHLQAHEVVLFTLFTPIYVSLLADWRVGRFVLSRMGAAFLAVIGAGVIKFQAPESPGLLPGFLIMQGANLCFAFGQVGYRVIRHANPGLRDARIYAWLFLGATIVSGFASFLFTDFSGLRLDASRIAVILYLGLVASGLGFFLWNRGAALVHSTSLLAVFNNASVPLGVIVSLVFFGETTHLGRLAAGSLLLILSLWWAALPDRITSDSAR